MTAVPGWEQPAGRPPGPPGPRPPWETAPPRGFTLTRKQLIAGLVVLLLLLGGGVGIALVVGGGGTPVGASEVFLEGVNHPSQNPFTPNVGQDQSGITAPTTSTTAGAATSGTGGITAYSGGTPGLYGGTRNVASCDANAMVTYLLQNPSKAAAWAGALGIQTTEIRQYVSTLTPIILRADTRVTNHGFVNGRANEIPAVLQAGTAVLVDRYGAPVVKCFCGNPLTPPRPSTRPRYRGTPWPGFRPGSVIVVTRTTTIIDTFTLVDPRTNVPFGRPAGTNGSRDGNPPGTVTPTQPPATLPPATLPPAQPPITQPPATEPPATQPPATGPSGQPLGTGDVQVTLAWGTTADLDLHVTDPSGYTINYARRQSPSGGSIDVDSNASCSNPTTSPVENIYWPTGGAPRGLYVVAVRYFAQCTGGSGPQSYTVTVRTRGQVWRQFSGTISPSATQEIVRFNIQ